MMMMKTTTTTTTTKVVGENALETVINSRKLSYALANPSSQRKRYYSPI